MPAIVLRGIKKYNSDINRPEIKSDMRKVEKWPQTRIAEFKCRHILGEKICDFNEFDTIISPQKTYFYP